MAELQAGAAPVTVGGVRLSSDAVSATVEPEGVRRGSRPSLVLSALEDAGLRADHAVALDARRIDPEVVASRGATRGAPTAALVGGAPGEVVVDVPPPPPGRGQVLLVENNGAVSWTFPEDASAAAAARRGRGDPSAHQRFVVPVAPTGEDVPGTRGIIGAVVRRVLRVLTFDLVDKVAGEVGDHFVSRWEEKTRPHRIRSFTPQDYKEQNVAPLDAAALRALAEGPALLLIHGTNSLTHSGFAAFPEDAVRAMHDRYQGRVFGFDHPTLSVDPVDNCKALAAMLPDGLTLDVDILCHSRGGLVARSLVELADSVGTSGKLRVRQVVFVATPNRGTPLADPERLGSLLDGLTNLLDLVPDNPVTDSLNGIVTLVRQLAVGALNGLDGLTSMRFVKAQDDNSAPAGSSVAAAGTFLGMLNQPRPATTPYRAIAADFEPSPESGLAMVARDKLVDALFGFEANDLIVPTASAFSWNGGPGFPVSDRLVLPPTRGVDHSGFWTTPEVLQTLATWLTPEGAAVRAAPVRVVAPASTSVAPVAGSLDEVDERFAAGDLDGVRRAIATLPAAQFDELRRLVGDVALLDVADRARGVSEPRDGTVFVVPGVMGSHLDAPDGDERDHVWLNPLRLVAGEIRRLRVTDGSRNGRGGGIRHAGLYRSYLPLVLALDERWEVVPVSYDWRLPLRTAADSLARAIRDHFNGRVGPAHIVCHSMGGLVARMLIAGHPDVWNALDSPKDRAKGGRLVMLGTPNRGSFSIGLAFTGDDKLVRWLAALDLVNSRAEVLKVLASFPGLYELLTAPDAGPEDSDTAKLYDAASWPDGLLDGALLAEAKATHALLAAKGFDRERTYYVAGSGHETPDAVKVGPKGSFRYRTTRAGDGRVPHSLGLADRSGGPLFAGRTWYTEADHGGLTTDGRVVRAVDAILRDGATTLLRDSRPPGDGARSSRDGKWLPAALVEPAEPVGPDVVAGAALRSPTASRGERRAAFQRAAATAVSGWLGTPPAAVSTAPVLRVRVLHASLEHSSYPVLVGHYRGDPIRGAEGFLDWRLEGQLSRRQAVERYPREIGDVLRITTEGGSPVGGIVVGLGGSGELTPTGLAAAVRDASLDHALEWLERPDERMVVSEGAIGITSVLLGSYGSIGMSLPASVAAIVEGVVLANALLAERNVADKVRIADLEIVERYSAPAEEAARVVRRVADQLPTAVRSLVTLAPDQWLSTGEGRRPAVPTSDYGAGMWHRLIVSTTNLDADGRWVRLHYTSLGSRARADQLVQDVDTRIIGRMLQDAVTRTSVDGSVNVALFEILFPNDVKRELAAVENVQLVLDARAADLPWEALTDRGALTGRRPLVHNAGLLRQLSIPTTGRADPSSGTGAALVVGDPPGPRAFGRLDGARREAREVAEQLGRRLAVTARIFDASSAPPDSATQVLSALMAEDYQVVHIAGHGHFEPPRNRKPAEVGEPAAPGTAEALPGEPSAVPVGGVVIGPGESEYLTASMFRNMRRPPDLVFLNCCHLGSVGATVIDDPTAPAPMAFARKRTNELAASLARELMSMGVKAVVAAGWSVSDKPAAAFAYRFYERMTAGAMFGEAVRSARSAAFASDGGASNTWAAYQCYGDPAFRLFAGEGDSRPSPPPVSADELIRRLEDISVQAGDAGADRRADLLDQTADLEERARELWSEGRVWSALGDAYRCLTSYEPAVRCYRKALEVKDSEVLIGSVEQLAHCEHRLAMELVAGRTKIVGLDKPNTPAALRAKAEERISTLDALGPSAERHVLRGGLYKQDARLSTGEERKKALKQAAEEYASAWRIDGKTYGAYVALQLNRLGATLPARTRSDLEAYLGRREPPAVVANFWDRAELGDFLLTRSLVDGTIDEKVETIAEAYVRAFAERSLPSNRASVTNHIDQLAEIAPSRWKPPLLRLHRHLVDWRPGLAQR